MLLDTIPEYLIDVAPSGVGGQLKGTMPRDDACGATSEIYEAVQPVIPRSQWRDIIANDKPGLKNDVAKIKSQRSESSCTSNQATQGWETLHNESFGKEYWVELSPISLYKRTGRSASSGSTVSDNVREMRDTGALPTHAMKSKLELMGLNPAHTMPETGFSTPFPNGWKETAKYFRLAEYFDIRGIDGFFSALLSGFAVGYGRAGHSILGVEAVWNQSKNSFYICYANSWAPTWGENGFGYDSEGFVRNAINQYGAFAYRTTVWDESFRKLVKDSI